MLLIKKIVKIFLLLSIILLSLMIIDVFLFKYKNVKEMSQLTKITLYDSDNNPFYEINNKNESSYIELDKVSENFIKTIIHIEDKRFYSHNGFDVLRIFQAIKNNITNDNLQGASTITQQYAKNVYLSNELSIIRKLKEIKIAINLEAVYTKEEILEGYINTIYFNHGIYGIYDASMFYFNKEPSELTLGESASLVAIIPSPNNYSPLINKSVNLNRKNKIIETLYNDKVITENDYNKAKNETLNFTGKRYEKYSNTVLFYKDMILNEFEKTALKGQNFNIYTSFDSGLNHYIDTLLKKNIFTSDIGIVILNDKGEIVCATGKNYKENEFNPAIDSNRMIGSTIKPMLYYEALNNGMNAMSKFKSEPTTFYINNTPFAFSNYKEKYQNTKITMGYALATSDNIYAVKTHLYIGSNKLISFLNSFNINNVENYPSLALGTQSMSLLKLTSIYNTFSQLGYYQPTSSIKYITQNNKTIRIIKRDEKQLLNSSTTFILNNLLLNTFDTNLGGNISVTGSSISSSLDYKVAAKTGLTDYDSYIVGFTPLYTIGIWSGNIDNSILSDTLSKSIPKLLFPLIMNYLMDKNKNIWYEEPNEVYSLFISPTDFNDGYLKKVYFLR